MKKVGVLMGSDSDLPVVRKSAWIPWHPLAYPMKFTCIPHTGLPLRLRHFVPVPRTGGSVYSFAPPAWPPTWPAPLRPTPPCR